jgi:hypothetical protein
MQYRLCRHTKANRSKCKSPALRGQDFCYFHDRHHRRHPGTRASVLPTADPGKPVYLDPLHDRGSVQIALSTVINALAMNTLDTRRASTLLYGIQLAASHLQPLPSLRDTGLSAPSEN